MLGVFARERRRLHQRCDNPDSPDQFGITMQSNNNIYGLSVERQPTPLADSLSLTVNKFGHARRACVVRAGLELGSSLYVERSGDGGVDGRGTSPP